MSVQKTSTFFRSGLRVCIVIMCVSNVKGSVSLRLVCVGVCVWCVYVYVCAGMWISGVCDMNGSCITQYRCEIIALGRRSMTGNDRILRLLGRVNDGPTS